MKLKLRLSSCILFVLILFGCTPNIFVVQENDLMEEELGAYVFGPIVESGNYNEILQFKYYGEQIRIPYFVQGWGYGIVSEFGWFLFVDGVLQPTRLETADGQIFREEAYMHEFGLAFEEIIEFDVVFTPVSGDLGEQVGLIGATLLRPGFMVEGVERPYFQIFHSLSATLPAELSINSNILNDFSVYSDISLTDIPTDIFDELMYMSGVAEKDTLLEILEHQLMIDLLGNREHEFIIYASDGLINFELQIFGGQEVTSRITFFVNHEPVSINGADFVEITMEQGKMAIIPIEIEIDSLNDLNSIYAIAMTTGDDYQLQDIFKARTLLLVNE